MQESQNVHLDPREPAQTAELARAEQEENLRRRKNHAGAGDGVQFSTIFAMVDNSLEAGAESLRKSPKRSSNRESESAKGPDLPVAAADVKQQPGDAPKEASKARTDQDQTPKAPKEAASKKAESVAEFLAHQAAVQSRAEPQTKVAARQAERVEVKVERREPLQAEKPRAKDQADRRAETKDIPVEPVRVNRESTAQQRREISEDGRSQDRRTRQKSKDQDDGDRGIREDRPRTDGPKASRADDDQSRQPRVREKTESRPFVFEKTDAKDSKSADRRADGYEISDKRETQETRSADSSAKKRGMGDLEKLTGLHAKSAAELVPIVMPVVQDTILRQAADMTAKGHAMDAVRATVKAVASTPNTASQQNAGQAGTQQNAAQAEEKLGQTARRLSSYLSGRTEATVKPEATFSDMVAKAKLFMDNGRAEMTIQLKPEQLGSLKIQMAVEDGKMEAHFVTDRPEVKALIEQNSDMLKSKLAEVGIEVSALSVEVRSDAGQDCRQDGRPSGLRRITEFAGADELGPLSDSNGAQTAYALAGMGTHLSLVA